MDFLSPCQWTIATPRRERHYLYKPSRRAFRPASVGQNTKRPSTSHRLGRKALADVATIARPDTILGWYRKLVACKFDGSKSTPRQTAHQARGRAADRSHGRRGTGTGIMTGSRGRWPIWATRFPIKRSATSCDATVCHRRRSASARAHGQPSFGPIWRCWRGPTSSEVPTLRGLVTYCVLFFIHLERRRVDIAGTHGSARCGIVDISCTTATPSSRGHSGLPLHQAGSDRWRCLRTAKS